jgi:hypothetical protein
MMQIWIIQLQARHTVSVMDNLDTINPVPGNSTLGPIWAQLGLIGPNLGLTGQSKSGGQGQSWAQLGPIWI